MGKNSKKELLGMNNQVNGDNFNETCKGYLRRAIMNMRENDGDYDNNLTPEQESRIWSGLRWAFDDMTMEQARKEWWGEEE